MRFAHFGKGFWTLRGSSRRRVETREHKPLGQISNRRSDAGPLALETQGRTRFIDATDSWGHIKSERRCFKSHPPRQVNRRTLTLSNAQTVFVSRKPRCRRFSVRRAAMECSVKNAQTLCELSHSRCNMGVGISRGFSISIRSSIASERNSLLLPEGMNDAWPPCSIKGEGTRATLPMCL